MPECEGCCGPPIPCLTTGKLYCRTLAGTTGPLCGVSEFVPSSPPKKYRVETWSGSVLWYLYWDQDKTCNTKRGETTESIGGTLVYNQTTCASTDTRSGAGIGSTSCVLVTTTATSKSSSCTSACANCWSTPYDNKCISDSRQIVLSDEDTPEDAYNRSHTDGSWGSWFLASGTIPPACNPASCCSSAYSTVNVNWTVNYQKAEWKVMATGLTPSTDYKFFINNYVDDVLVSTSEFITQSDENGDIETSPVAVDLEYNFTKYVTLAECP